MLDDFFKESLKLSGQLRPNYPQSLGNKADNWGNVIGRLSSNIPEIFSAIYGNISGTKLSIKNQELMDYTPGYRLIHISEIVEEKNILDSVFVKNDCSEIDVVIPLLANYSSDYICYCKYSAGEECICALMHDEGELVLMHKSPKKFLETICELYKQGVYFLDSDGYLDYDSDKEGIVGSKLNPGIEYWG